MRCFRRLSSDAAAHAEAPAKSQKRQPRQSVYKAFIEAKAQAMIDLLDVNALMVTLPWLEAETKETMAVMGADFWKYGVHENLPEIAALTQYLHEQGLIERKVAVEELFAPAVFEMAKV